MLFVDPTTDGVYSDVTNILTFITSYFAQFGVSDHRVDVQAIESVVRNMRRDFPHVGGLEEASPFKKAANFVCWFVAEKPVGTPLPADKVGKDLSRNTNAVLALSIAIESLHEAVLKWRRDGSEHVLKNRITLSKHSFVDIVEALAAGSPITSFKFVSVLLEQMAYKTNPDCQYPH